MGFKGVFPYLQSSTGDAYVRFFGGPLGDIGVGPKPPVRRRATHLRLGCIIDCRYCDDTAH